MTRGTPLTLRMGTSDPGVQEAPPPIVSHWCETRQSRCGLDLGPVGPTIFGRKAEFHSGDMKVQEAKAACRNSRAVCGKQWPVSRARSGGPFFRVLVDSRIRES